VESPDAATAPTPTWRGRLHQIAFFVSLPMGAALVALSRTGEARAAAAVFSVGLAGVFGVSAAYHRGQWSDRAKVWMRRFDHSMIYVLIAGSYTPFCLLVLDGATGLVLLSIVWAGALVGITMKMVRPLGLEKLTAFLYIALGWVAVFALPQMIRGLSAPAAVLVIAGGLLYTLGAIALASHRPDPRPAVFGYHEVWHASTIGASLCHWLAVLTVVLAAR
jgi:hemolysin III